MNIIIGNIFSAIACCLVIAGTQAKDFKGTMKWQTMDAIMFTISNIILGGISGVLVNGLAALRAMTCYFEKQNKITKCIFILAPLVIGLIFRDKTWYGWLPIIATVSYSMILMNTNNVIVVKITLIFNNLMIGLYALMTSNYVNAIFSPIVAISLGMSVVKLFQNRIKERQN